MCVESGYIDPFTDFGFKHIFGREEHKKFLISFLNDLLELENQIVDITYKNLEKLGVSKTDRRAIYDIYCEDSIGDRFIVELQRSEQRYFKDRSIYYTTFPIQEQSKKGDWDYKLERVYFIAILEFTYDDKYLTKAQLKDEDNNLFYDKLAYYYIQIPNFKKESTELSNHLEYWLWYLKNLATIKTPPKNLENDEIISEAFDIAKFVTLSKDEQFQYQMDLKARLDYKTVLDTAEEKGIKKGKLEIARQMLNDGVRVEVISKYTGLSKEEIERLVRISF
jgi:predicted transposase/invertase (TIGR01784 family)